MAGRRLKQLAAAASLACMACSSTLAARLDPRVKASDVESMGLGVLVKDGKQTSCALGVFLSSASFVAASCLDYRDNTNIHRPGTQYDVVVKDAYNGATRKYNVPFSNITVHPSYDPASGANNIAILQYNPENVGDYYNTVAAGPDLWDSIIYVQQGLEDMDDLKWGPLRSVEAAGEDEADSACSDFSQAYAKGNGTIACFRTPVDPPSSSLSACKVPYPLAYAKYKGTLYQAGVFSHAVVDGEDMCDFEKMRMYYTLFGNYIAFAQDTVGSRRTLVSMKNDDGVKPNDDPDFSVGGMTGQVIQEGARLLSGDFFTNQTDPDHHTGDTEDSEDKDSSDSGDGLSQGATIAIAVCCSVGAMLLAIGLFFAIRRWKTNRHMDRDPVLENNTRIILADEFGATSPDYAQDNDDKSNNSVGPPPAYMEGERPTGNAEVPAASVTLPSNDQVAPLPQKKG